MLDWPELMPRLCAWLGSQPPAETLFVVGGGMLVEAIREADQLRPLGDEAAHWQAIRAMTINAEMIRQKLVEVGQTFPLGLSSGRRLSARSPEKDTADKNVCPSDALCTSLLALREAAPTPRRLVIDPYPIIHDEDRVLMGDDALPASWDVTSDSIAARIAALSRASRLTLLKSALPPGGTIAAATAAGYVDRYFPQACRAIERVDCVNLRLDSVTAMQLRSSHSPSASA